ncbi:MULTISPECIES: cation:proton antiporter [Paenibacillus]|uniref:Monovalent cation:proton antiporter-2 (CPA2) family protein n=1 Tax=Paenibacillus pabuli TaxID=1472 RepID=A0A855Y5J4_9BACL|nr:MULTISPECIES: cation:proton antiporter [Paenibacillus]PWW35099.1 monovalent cation:proton antiporter-2 (CPA2) family protein [Paenibacillus pabuli]PXW01857.1 monovalent cation:proton antiporter-2 (CPA2) family protein [Paenibacillus taichungensis]RAI91787.1 monovalent cation:proton antiporter-2 (CPA2) family protein [Paenibacillus pabuli]
MEFILVLALILIFTKLAGDLSVRLGQPSVLGKLIVGVILGPALLGWVQQSDFIHYMAEIGVLLLMFIAGLETDLEQLKKNWKAAFAVAVGGIILPFIGGYGAAAAFGMSQTHALFFGLLFCATSVSISVQTLKDMNQLSSREGTTILGAAVVDDVLVVVILAVMMSLLGTGATDTSISLLIGKKLLFFVVIIAASWFLVPRIMKWMAPLKVTETVITAGLIICFGFSYFAEWMGVAGIIGAFAAGIAISQTNFKHEVETKLEPIAYGIFVPVFFVSIGLNVTFDGVGSQIWFIIVISLIAIVTKLLGGGAGARLTGFDRASSLAIGSGMISRGEVALIIASTGLASGLLDGEYFTSVVIMVIVTTLVTPPLLKITFARKKGETRVEKGIEESHLSG